MTLRRVVLVESVAQRSGFVIVFWVVLCALAAPGLLRLTLDNSAEVFFIQDAAPLEVYRRFQLSFGRDQALRLAVRGPGLWTPQGLAWLSVLEEEAQALNGVIGAAGLYSHHRHRFSAWPPASPAAFKAKVLADSLDRQAGWVDREGDTATILLALYNLPPDRLRETLTRLRRLLADSPPGVEAWIAGLPAVQSTMDDELIGFVSIFFPILAVAALVLLRLVLGPVALYLPALLLVGIVEVIVLGSMGYLGVSVNLVTIVLVPLTFVISLATAVHLLLHFRRFRRRGLGGRAALKGTYRDKQWAVLWAGITTAVGFGSLSSSAIPPVRTLGILAALAMALLTGAAFTLFPALLAVGKSAHRPGQASAFERWGQQAGDWIARRAVARRGWVSLFFATAASLSLLGLAFLDTDTSLLSYLPRDHPERTRLEFLQQRGIGVVTAELFLDGQGVEPPPFAEESQLRQLARLCSELRSLPGVLGAVSASDLLSTFEDLTGPGEPATPETALARIHGFPEAELFLRFLRTPDGTRARISLLIPMRGFQSLQPLLERALEVARQRYPDLKVWLTGRYPLVLSAQRNLFGTMIFSGGLTLAVIMGLFGVLLREGRLWVAAGAVNLFPVLFVLGAMGWSGVPLDSTTVMIASVVLGLAVDDTFHALGLYRRHRRGSDPATAAIATLRETAAAHTLTSVLLAAGFGVCALSGLVPIARFGALTGLAILVALVADLVLLPALLAEGDGA